MDMGEFTLHDGTIIRVYGTPGQRRFAFMWHMLAEDALGVIILINARGNDTLGEMSDYLDHFGGHIGRGAAVIGVTGTDERPEFSLAPMYDLLAARKLILPIFTVDVREIEDVKLLIETLLSCIELAQE